MQGTPNHPHAYRYQRIQNALLQAGAAGVSITVISPDGTWMSGAGKADLGKNTNMTPCHRLRGGSTTKLFTAITIMKLQEEGVLDIDDKINRYIPASITDKISNANDVTIRQLLNHSSGIRNYGTITNFLDILNLSAKRLSAEESLEYIYNKPADFLPGTDKLYANSNYLLLGLVIKHATGRKAWDVVRDKIITPLNLSNTFPGTEKPSMMAHSYYDTYENGVLQDVSEIEDNAVGGDGMLDGGIITSSGDLATLMRALDAGSIVTPATLTEMQQFETITQDLGQMAGFLKEYGLGLMKVETDYGWGYGHYGRVHAFNCLIFHFPAQQTTVSIMLNSYSEKIFETFNTEQMFNYLFAN